MTITYHPVGLNKICLQLCVCYQKMDSRFQGKVRDLRIALKPIFSDILAIFCIFMPGIYYCDNNTYSRVQCYWLKLKHCYNNRGWIFRYTLLEYYYKLIHCCNNQGGIIVGYSDTHYWWILTNYIMPIAISRFSDSEIM